jgi:hypothetical protein
VLGAALVEGAGAGGTALGVRGSSGRRWETVRERRGRRKAARLIASSVLGYVAPS